MLELQALSCSYLQICTHKKGQKVEGSQMELKPQRRKPYLAAIPRSLTYTTCASVPVMTFSGALRIGDLNDYIAPTQACVVSLNGSKLSEVSWRSLAGSVSIRRARDYVRWGASMCAQDVHHGAHACMQPSGIGAKPAHTSYHYVRRLLQRVGCSCRRRKALSRLALRWRAAQ